MVAIESNNKISLDWNAENLKIVLTMAIESGWQDITDLDVAKWCEEFVFRFKDTIVNSGNVFEHAALSVAEEIAIQWDFNVYTQLSFSRAEFNDMQRTNIHRVKFPRHLYQAWLKRLDDAKASCKD
ncbi:hypothetical protein K1X84_01985 [bacterium]|nr:hypothetical protein [bacterium]